MTSAQIPDLSPKNPAVSNVISEKIEVYVDMLSQWSKAINLVGAISKEKIYSDLVADSFYLAHFLEKLLPTDWNGIAWDFGAGAGLPGIPLRIVWQKGQYTMIEAREKRALFLANALARLHLERTSIFRGTVQNFIKGKKAGLIISRAFMPWEKLLSLAKAALEENAPIIIMANKEAPAAPSGWELSSSFSYSSSNKKRWFWAFTQAAS